MKILKLKIRNYKGGYSLVELLFYISIFTVVSLAVINAMIVMTKSFKEMSIQAELIKGGDIMERISREVRRATGINSISANDLKIDTTDANNLAETMEFLLSGSDVQLIEKSVLTGNLNTSNITVSALTFTQLTTSQGAAVKIVLTVNSKSNLTHSEVFYDTVVLRGDY